MSVILRSLSRLYGSLIWLRGWLYDRGALSTYRGAIPVVSIGNITAGGNGKTPLCLFVADALRQRGLRPAIVSRGYGGKTRGPHRVVGTDTPELVGDEPVLMARYGFPIYIARRRVAAVKRIEREGSADVIVLDDGLQHRALHREVDIVSIFSGTNEAVEDFVKGEILPLGLFREARSKALKRASIVVASQRKVMREDELPEVDHRIARVLPKEIPVFRSFLIPKDVMCLKTGEMVVAQPIAAFAAIANPEGFFQSLEGLGFTVQERFCFDDHYQYDEADLMKIIESCPRGWLVCTEKDAVKLERFSPVLLERIAVLRVAARVVPEAAFIEQVIRKIQR
jgi:tetraacyldisaccharide 4'-kinase